MSKCASCNRDMKKKVSCTLKQYDNRDNPRVPYERDEEGNCHDCGTPDGGLHHPGCDMERCADCGGQAISCDCPPKAGMGMILRVLTNNQGLCMDNEKERKQLARLLYKEINKHLDR